MESGNELTINFFFGLEHLW